MTKQDLVIKLCSRIPYLEKSMAIHVVESLTQILSESFIRGENVYLRGLGTMEVKTTKEKKGRNINAGTPVVVPPQRTVKFKLSKQLKNRMNNGN